MKLMIVGFAGVAFAQSGSVTFANPSGYSTKSFNQSAASTHLPNDDYSNEQLAFLWDQVGPRATAAVTTVVEPTADSTSFPQPGPIHPLVPAYVPEVADAKLPDDFLWGVASAGRRLESDVARPYSDIE